MGIFCLFPDCGFFSMFGRKELEDIEWFVICIFAIRCHLILHTSLESSMCQIRFRFTEKYTGSHQFVLFPGFNPVWYDSLRFTIHSPELAMVRFVVEDYDKTSKNDFVGQYTLPLVCMQQGRHESSRHTLFISSLTAFLVYQCSNSLLQLGRQLAADVLDILLTLKYYAT